MLSRPVTDRAAASVIGDAPWVRALVAAEPASRRGQIVSALREAIVTGRIPSGAQLKQDEIGAVFHASPGPVREAFRQLVSEGLVEHHPNRGAFVSEVPTEELLEVVLPIRIIAESYAMKKVSRDLNPVLVERLKEQIDAMDRGAGAGNLAEVIEADVQFHQAVMDAADSYHVTQLWASVLSRMRVQLYRLGPRHRSLEEVPEEHRQLLSALESKDSERIDSTLREHILEASSALLSAAGNGSRSQPESDRPRGAEHQA